MKYSHAINKSYLFIGFIPHSTGDIPFRGIPTIIYQHFDLFDDIFFTNNLQLSLVDPKKA
jgi:hypothetical protein